jgi:hypothetical protein
MCADRPIEVPYSSRNQQGLMGGRSKQEMGNPASLLSCQGRWVLQSRAAVLLLLLLIPGTIHVASKQLGDEDFTVPMSTCFWLKDNTS